jgi:hypothetical protein
MSTLTQPAEAVPTFDPALARARLVLGISNVGFWVLVSTALLILFLAGGVVPPSTGGMVLVATVLLGVQAGFDLVGGYFLRPRPRPVGFLGQWLRASLGYAAVFAGLVFLHAVSFAATRSFLPAVAGGLVLLGVGRLGLFRVLTGVRVSRTLLRDEPALVAENHDPGFTGGVVGPGGIPLWPRRWIQDLPAAALAVELARRSWTQRQGLARRAVLLVAGFHLAGAAAAALLLDLANRPFTEALILQMAAMTLWSFLGLLILPAWSRDAVFAADAAVADRDALQEWIRRFPALAGEDGHPSHSVQTIFYPVPSAAERLARREVPAPKFTAGSLARNHLYFSLAGLTPLGRAVHCNIGRPELWVYPPMA